MMAILAAVLFTILLVVGNTMAQAVRERTSELAVLKTLGFSDAQDPDARPCRVSVHCGGRRRSRPSAWPGLLVQFGGDPTGGLLAIFVLPGRDVIVGVGLMALVGIMAGLLPATSAMRIKITDALRKA